MSPYETSSEDLSCSPVFNCKQVTHSSSSSGERFPEDLSPLSSSFPSTSEVITDFSESSPNYIEWSESSDNYIQFKEEKVTSSWPNFTLAKIPFEQLCYFVKRYLKSVDKNPRQTRMAGTWYGQKPEETFQVQSRRLQSTEWCSLSLAHVHRDC